MIAKRPWAYLLLVAAGLFLFLPRLGDHSLWEEDEAHNAECAREMAEAATWVVPTFNYKLRPDKPVLQYWCLRLSFLAFGENEWAARLPSMLASIRSLLLCYELGRALFDARTGLVAGLVLASSLLFCVAAHATTPDAFLVVTTLAALTAFAKDYRLERSGWLALSAIASGLAVLAKGPVGLVLPLGIVGLFLLWQRQLGLVIRKPIWLGMAAFALIAIPWYLLVGLETRFEFVRGFFLRHNLSRFQQPMEGHTGNVLFHPLVLFVTFAPGSVFLLLSVWAGWRGEWASQPQSWRWRQLTQPSRTGDWAYRLLGCWCGVWLVFFSLAATKLPNYLLPMFPALAVLVARFLVRWLGSDLRLPRWLENCALAVYASVGVIIGVGLILAAGAIPQVNLKGRALPELLPLAVVGLIPIFGGWLVWKWRSTYPERALATLLGNCILLVAVLGAFGPVAVESSRAVKVLAERLNQVPVSGDVLIGCHDCYHPSLVFYTRRQVARSLNDQRALDLLSASWPSFLLVTEPNWARLRNHAPASCRVLGGSYEFRHGCRLLLVHNPASSSVEYPEATTPPRPAMGPHGHPLSLGPDQHRRRHGSATAAE